jgi:hypothetical protein
MANSDHAPAWFAGPEVFDPRSLLFSISDWRAHQERNLSAASRTGEHRQIQSSSLVPQFQALRRHEAGFSRDVAVQARNGQQPRGAGGLR